MKIALFNQSLNILHHNSENKNNRNNTPSFARKIPAQISDTFTKLRKEVASASENKKKFFSVPVFENSQETAAVTVEQKAKNWFLSFFFSNTAQGRHAEVTHTKGKIFDIQEVLKKVDTKKAFDNFLKENGIDLSAM